MAEAIIRRTPQEIELLREAGRIVAEVLDQIHAMIRPGVSTIELDRAAVALIQKNKSIATFYGYAPFGYPPYPGHICASINEEVVHGIPGNRTLKEGDIISVDVGVTYRGYVGDAARTFIVGSAKPEVEKLVETCRVSLEEAIKILRPGVTTLEIGATVQKYVERHGFSVVRDYTGHGVGDQMHLPPQIPNYAGGHFAFQNTPLPAGAVLAIEPMVNAGTYRVRTMPDRWTVVTADGKPSAHFEHTVVLTADGCDVLTRR